MGRRIRYRPNRSVEQFPGVERRRPGGFWTQQTLVIIGLIWGVLLVAIVAAAFFLMENRKFQNQFAPLVDVCNGKWVNVSSTYSATPGTHPAVAVTNSSGAWTLDRRFLPGNVSAQSLEETQVVLCVGNVYEIFIESCTYIDPDDPRRRRSYVERYYNQQQARLIEAKTGRVITEQTFTGKSAHYCYEKEWFQENKNVKKLPGTPISEDDIVRWAMSHLSIN